MRTARITVTLKPGVLDTQGKALVGGLLGHPLREPGQVVLGEPDRHGEVFVSGAELERKVLVESLEQVRCHAEASFDQSERRRASSKVRPPSSTNRPVPAIAGGSCP